MVVIDVELCWLSGFLDVRKAARFCSSVILVHSYI